MHCYILLLKNFLTKVTFYLKKKTSYLNIENIKPFFKQKSLNVSFVNILKSSTKQIIKRHNAREYPNASVMIEGVMCMSGRGRGKMKWWGKEITVTL